jgi:hypothetical protein
MKRQGVKMIGSDCLDVLLSHSCTVDLESFVPAPTGSNQLNNDSNWSFVVPFNATITKAYIMCNTGIAVGDSSNHYELNLYNGSSEMLSSNVSLVAGLSAYLPKLLTVDQNATVFAGDTIKLRVDIKDNGSIVPDLSAATFKIFITYRII